MQLLLVVTVTQEASDSNYRCQYSKKNDRAINLSRLSEMLYKFKLHTLRELFVMFMTCDGTTDLISSNEMSEFIFQHRFRLTSKYIYRENTLEKSDLEFNIQIFKYR